MHLFVPASWDRRLILPLSKIKATIEIYGVLPTSLMGSGGFGPDIPQITTKQAEEYIGLAHSAGLKYNYLLNAPCLNNMEWQEDTHRELLQHLEWLSNAKVDGVNVAIPYLLELIKTQFPHLRVEVSTIAHVSSVARAKFFESLGADSIMLDSNINRDFKLLKAIRSTVNCELGVLTNSSCLYQCPYEYYHNNTLGHASQSQNPLSGSYMDYCVFHCVLSSISDTSQLIKSRWIRPEDIHIYQEMGIDFFRIGGRAMSTERIINAAAAYSSLHYQGNLYDILNNFSPKTYNAKQKFSSTLTAAIASPLEIYIDNQALEGFLELFKKQDCLSGCSQCNYCQEIADKVVKFDRSEADKYISVLKKFLDDLTSSKIFRRKLTDDLTSSKISRRKLTDDLTSSKISRRKLTDDLTSSKISRRKLTTAIDKMIKELEKQRKDLELLMNMFACKKHIFDSLIRQYFRLWQMKSELDETLVVLPQEEKEYLESELGLKRRFEYYEEQMDYAIRRHGKLITIDQTLSLINKIDELVLELKMRLNEHSKGAQEALPKIKDILRKKVGPLLFGIALIAADIPLSSLATVIGGTYVIYNAIVLNK